MNHSRRRVLGYGLGALVGGSALASTGVRTGLAASVEAERSQVTVETSEDQLSELYVSNLDLSLGWKGINDTEEAVAFDLGVRVDGGERQRLATGSIDLGGQKAGGGTITNTGDSPTWIDAPWDATPDNAIGLLSGEHTVSEDSFVAGETYDLEFDLAFTHDVSGATASDTANLDLAVESVVPNSEMFQSPMYQWYAGTVEASDGEDVSTLPDALGGRDGDPVGNPMYRSAQPSVPTVELDGSDDGFTYTPASSHPSGSDEWSIAATVQVISDGYLVWWGERSDQCLVNLRFSDGAVEMDNYGVGQATANVPYNQLVTVGARYDGSTVKVYVDGGEQTAENSVGSLNVTNANHSIAFDAEDDRFFCGVRVHDIVISAASESDQAFADYHTDRLG